MQFPNNLLLWFQLYGRRAAWEDPADWVLETYPWPHPTDAEWPSLLRLRPEDVGYDMQGVETTSGRKSSQTQQSDAEGDPLVSTCDITNLNSDTVPLWFQLLPFFAGPF